MLRTSPWRRARVPLFGHDPHFKHYLKWDRLALLPALTLFCRAVHEAPRFERRFRSASRDDRRRAPWWVPSMPPEEAT
jgi:hypothetical protein